jgi:hypothetical protein
LAITGLSHLVYAYHPKLLDDYAIETGANNMIAGRRESYRNHGSQAELAKLTMLRGRTPETQSPSGKAFATFALIALGQSSVALARGSGHAAARGAPRSANAG